MTALNSTQPLMTSWVKVDCGIRPSPSGPSLCHMVFHGLSTPLPPHLSSINRPSKVNIRSEMKAKEEEAELTSAVLIRD